MADIIGVLSCALHAAHKIYDLSQTIKDAPDVVRTLEKEAGRVEHLLNLVLGTPGSTPQPWGSVDHYLLQGLVEDVMLARCFVENLDVFEIGVCAKTSVRRQCPWRGSPVDIKLDHAWQSRVAILDTSKLTSKQGKQNHLPCQQAGVWVVD